MRISVVPHASGKELKGASRAAGAKGAAKKEKGDAALLAKMRALQEAQYIRRLAEQTRKLMKVRCFRLACTARLTHEHAT